MWPGLYRAPAVILLLLTGVLLSLAILLLGPQRLSAPAIGGWWSRRLLSIFNLQIEPHGEALTTPHLQVANHISWLDMFVLASLGHVRYVAKSEVDQWPLINLLARAMGTVYIRRGKGGAAPVLTQTTPMLQNGESFLFFPEGTTTDGMGVKTFHARLFSAAVNAQVPVQAIGLSYEPLSGAPDQAPFIGDDTLFAHILRLLSHPGHRVTVNYCRPIPASTDAQALARQSQQAIEAIRLQADQKPDTSRQTQGAQAA